jgi:DNA repair protein RadC
MSLKDWPVRKGPLEKLLAKGAHCLSDTELPAVLLGGGQGVVDPRDFLVTR